MPLLCRLIFSLLFLALVCIPSRVYSYESIYYSDDFNSLDSWDIITGNLSNLLRNPGSVTISTFDSRNSDYLVLKREIPDGNYRFKIRLRSDKVNFSQGAGITIADRYVEKVVLGDLAPYQLVFSYWPINFANDWGLPSAYSFDGTSFSTTNIKNIVRSSLEMQDWQDVEFIYRNNRYYFDFGSDIYISPFTLRSPKRILLGNPITTTTNQVGFSSFQVDSITIWQIDLPTPEFTSYYSQLDEEWAGIEYDSASEWAAEGKRGIGEWGCALSSAAMILKNYNILSPSGLTTTPPVLNYWLQAQPDGYIGDGLLNWLAVSRYARESHLHEPPYAPHSLEYERLGYTESFVSEKLEAGKPVILSNLGHSVVAFEEDEDKWWVADPVASASSQLAKDAAIFRVHSYTPSSTDLSYMMFVSEPETSFTLLNGSGESVALDSGIEELKSSSGETRSQKIVLLAKPTSGEYKLSVTGGGWHSYLYDKEGRVTVDSFTESGEYEISFDGLDTSKSVVKEASLPIPVAPNLVAPADNSFSNKKQVALEWASTLDGARYEYEVRNSLAEVVLSGSSDILQAIWKPTIEGIYTWKVRACNLEDVCGEWSEARAITIDRTAPKLIGQTEFSGWYHEAQTSYFQFTDEHMLADYSDPSCGINTQGKNIKCSLKPKICDLAGNCYNKKLVSNPTNIDWTAPTTKAKLLSLPSWWYRLTKGWRVAGVIIEASDKHSGVSETLYRVNSGEWKVYKHPFVVADRSPIVVEYKAIDGAENESQVKSVRMK